jgi:hypothetical protein
VHGLVTYVVRRFNIMGARQLTQDDVFTSGAVALARAVEQPELAARISQIEGREKCQRWSTALPMMRRESYCIDKSSKNTRNALYGSLARTPLVKSKPGKTE